MPPPPRRISRIRYAGIDPQARSIQNRRSAWGSRLGLDPRKALESTWPAGIWAGSKPGNFEACCPSLFTQFMLNGRLRQALSKTEVQHRARANTKTRKTHAVTFWNIKKRDSRKSFTRHVTVTPGNTSNPPSAIPDKAQTQPQDPESVSIPGG